MAAAAVAGVLLLAACPGGTSKPRFAGRADAVCDRVSGQARSEALQLFGLQPTPTELSELLARLLPRLRAGLSALRQLEPPGPDRQGFQAVLSFGDDELGRFDAYRMAAAAGDQPRTDDFFNREPFAAFKAQAARVGLTLCAAQRYGPDPEPASSASGLGVTGAKKEFIEKGDAACDPSRNPAGALYYQYFSYFRDLSGKPPPLGLWGSLLGRPPSGGEGQLVPFFRQQVTSLRSLEVPPADRDRIAAVFARYDALLAQAQEAGDLALAGDRPGFRQGLAQVAATSREADRELRDYGFTQCAPSDLLLVGRVDRDTFRLP